MKKNQGNLIVFEGPDGSGKTTLANLLREYFLSKALDCFLVALPERTTGTLGELICALHDNPQFFGVNNISSTSLLALHFAARLDTLESEILPRLESRAIVILDRFWWSAWVYGRSYGANRSVLEAMIEAEKKLWDEIDIDHVFLLSRPRELHTPETEVAFEELSRLYREISELEIGHYPIHPIENKKSLEEMAASLIRITGK